ncbi:MAG: hypothetical protein KKI08_01780, partial [Armatimonadetes bacterium]|nr:hypothetical protein [Armatimonadota bacterium]
MRYALALLLILVASAAFAGGAADTNWPRLTILPPPQAPVIDGVLSPGEWDKTVVVTGFARLGQNDLVARQPIVHMAWTPQALLVAAVIPNPPGQKAHARATDFDGTVWADDSVEVHVDRGHQHKQNAQFIVNALGTKFDALGGDKNWNAEWDAKAQNHAGQWVAEFAIPWAALAEGPRFSRPQPGDMDGFNLIVNSSYLGGTLTIAPLKRSAHDTPSFAHLVYSQEAALSVERLDAGSLTGLALRSLGQGEVTVQYTLSRGGQQLDAQTVKLAAGATASLPVKIPVVQDLPQPGNYALNLRATSGGVLLLVRRADFTVRDALRVTCSANETHGTLAISLQTERSIFPVADTEYALTITGPAGPLKQLTHQRLLIEPGAAALTLTRAEVPPGKLTLKVTAVNAKTQRQYTVERTLDSPLHPEWLGTKEGLT